MNEEKIILSIIIVHYKKDEDLINCVKSIVKSNTKFSFEIIVVDNFVNSKVEEKIKGFKKVRYFKMSSNLGYGGGNNFGSGSAKGEYLLFLNPDTIVLKDALNNLINFIKDRKDAGIVAPILLDKNNHSYPQGNKKLGLLEGIICLSFINRIFPKNKVSKSYFLQDWDRKTLKEVDVVPGTAFVIKKDIFEKLGGFDDRFFLYFEEFDLCRRIKAIGYKLYILPTSKIIHYWGSSTKRIREIKNIFEKSKFLYFRKYYGLIPAMIIKVFTNINKINLVLTSIILVSIFLNFNNLSKLMSFIGDQGWFYLSARDMILNHKISLVGITSSHTWLYQGPLWTYILAFSLWAFNFNPVAGSYLTAFLGVVTVFLIYKACSVMFSKKVGIIASLLYATSPLTIMNSRFAYHTSPIPLFTTLYILFLYKWINGKNFYFPLTLFILGILYNLELATVSFWLVLIIMLVYGFWKKTKWLKNIINKKIIFLSFFSFIVPIIPIIIYDTNHNFTQTLGFGAWMAYRSINFIISLKDSFAPHHSSMLPFLYDNISRLIFMHNGKVALIIFLSFLLIFFVGIYKMFLKKQYNKGYLLLALIFTSLSLGIIISETPSDAYIPAFFPSVFMILALSIHKLMSKKYLFYPTLIFVVVIIVTNSYLLIKNNYNLTPDRKGVTFVDRMSSAKEIVRIANNREYNLVGKGWLGDFKSYTMNYEYLAWWLGNAPSKNKSSLVIYISEDKDKISVESKNR